MRSDILMLFFFRDHTIRSPEKYSAEDIEHKMKLFEKFYAGEDENNTHDDSSQNSPLEDFRLLMTRDGHPGKNHEKNKEIVDRERFFYEISSKKFHSCGRVFPEKKRNSKKYSNSDPDSTPDEIGPKIP